MARQQLTLRAQETPRLGWATPPRLLGNGEWSVCQGTWAGPLGNVVVPT